MYEIKIYGDVDTGLSEFVRSELPDSPVTVRINSDGGSVREGLAIYNMLKEHPHEVTTIVDGGAFSIAAYIALAGDRRLIAENGMMMVHGARTETFGNLSEHKQTLDMLETADAAMRKAFVSTTGKTEDEISAMMAVDTWLDADQALAEGLVTEITKKQPLSASAFSDYILKMMPPRLVAKLTKPMEECMSNDVTPKAASYHQLKAIANDKDFIVAMLEEGASEDEAKAARAKAMEEKAEMVDALAEENEELKSMLEEANAKLKMMEEGPEKEEAVEAELEPEAAEEEEEEMVAIRARSGVSPVANAGGVPQKSAYEKWKSAIQAEVELGRPRADAVRNANRKNPGLRAAYLNEIK